VIALTVTLATFMEVLDTSVANVALPHIAGSLSADADAATWILTAYLVSNAIVLPLSGWLATVIGRKRFYMLCVALFTGSSFLCGIAPSLDALICFRVLQGVGGGGLQPSEQAILADTFPEERRGMAFAVYGMAVVLAPAIGPTLGGFITDHASWRWIFFINLPVGLLSLALTSRVVEDPPWARGEGARARVDWLGVALIVLCLGSLQYVLDKGQRDDWLGSRVIVAFCALSAIAGVALVLWEFSRARPVLDLSLLRVRNFAIALVMMFMLGAVLFGSIVLLPLYLQTLLGYTAQQAGMVLSPGALVVILLLPLVGRLLTKVDARWLIGFGFAVTALALWHMTGIYLGIDFKTAVLYRVYLSVGLAFLFVPINTVSYVGVPKEKNNQVSALINLARNLGGSVGISFATTWVARRTQVRVTQLAAHATPFDLALRRELTAIAHTLSVHGMSAVDAARHARGLLYGRILAQATTLAYIDTFALLALASGAMTVLVLALRRRRAGAGPAMAH
jgi:DHA2 family multidrug resistance protein